MKKLRVAVAKMAIVSDIRKNSAVIQDHMKTAARDGADLVQFSEGALSGYVKEQIKDWSEVDWIALDDELVAIGQLAKELRIWVVLGSAHRQQKPKRPFNSLYVISAEGKIHARYDKRITSHTESRDWFEKGTAPVVFTIRGWKIGLGLCIEVHFSELFEQYRRMGVHAVLLSAYSDDPIFEVTARAHASMNNIWVGYSVPVMRNERAGSMLIGPDGSVQEQTEESGLAIGDMDMHDERWIVPLLKAKPWREKTRIDYRYRYGQPE
jgi:predicted amidohydrolase